jgi:hypothetical protein
MASRKPSPGIEIAAYCYHTEWPNITSEKLRDFVADYESVLQTMAAVRGRRWQNA